MGFTTPGIRRRSYPHRVPDVIPQPAAELAPTGTLRAVINLGNPVLAGGTAAAPTGVTVDIACELGRRLGVAVSFTCVDAARKSFTAVTSRAADIAFLAVEPARAAEVAFTAAYVAIEGVYVVPRTSSFHAPADLDRPGVRVGVKEGSAYDLFLTRTLQHATLVRGTEGVAAFEEQGLDAAGSIRQPANAYAATRPDIRVIEERFMQIQQAVAIAMTHSAETLAYVSDVVEELKASGFIAASLTRSGQDPALVPSS